ncbi:metal transporter [Gemmobacter aquarius]|uniref:Metal transporter n=1 Tax=Paragemmobacter aquarius TaxID=2169400 RepID=A0A2S0UHR3_9RHOB|nr:ion channel [Gemmobacter aquarius]AWB47378.1 metal transporter [Gemmobacter aquarius]
MLHQIALGTGVMMVSILIGAVSALLMEIGFSRWHGWLVKEPHRPKMILAVLTASLWVVATTTAGVWLWAIVYDLLGVFATFEEALYFSIVSFTTLGFGDVILPHEWRILSGMTATNGFLNFGLMTALMVEAFRLIRTGQVEASR